MPSSLTVETIGPVVHIWMNRPELHNAFDASLVAELTDAFSSISAGTRVLVLAGRGKSFSAGAQAEWMKQQGAATFDENLNDTRLLARLFLTIAACPVPTLARVQGAAIGGGAGLVCACDIAIASEDAVFATSEVRLGLIPAVIAPYVVNAIGQRWSRRLFLTGERIQAAQAQDIGFVHDVAPPEELDKRIEECLTMLLAGAPAAQREAKSLLDAVGNQPMTDALAEDTAQRIAQRRSHAEAAEGLSAFLSKRKASWVPKS